MTCRQGSGAAAATDSVAEKGSSAHPDVEEAVMEVQSSRCLSNACSLAAPHGLAQQDNAAMLAARLCSFDGMGMLWVCCAIVGACRQTLPAAFVWC